MQYIRRWLDCDAQDLALALNNKKIQDNLRDGLPFPYTIDDAKEYIEMAQKADKNTSFLFAIISDNKVIGSIGATRLDNVHVRTAEIGYYISELYWGKKITSNAVKELCKYIFDNTDIIRLFAMPYSNNIGSNKVLENAGFCFEGLLRKNAIKNNQVLDMNIYALVKD